MTKTYLITGATSALGLALLEQLADAAAPGDRILAQGFGDLSRLAGLCQAHPGLIRPYDVDLSNPQAVSAFAEDVRDSFPVLTHLIHLPALQPLPSGFDCLDEDRFAQERAVRLDSAVQLCKAFVPEMARAGYGRVLLLHPALPPQGYAAARTVQGALDGLVQALAAEYDGTGVTVNCVAPGPMASRQEPDSGLLRAEEAVPALLFLLSDGAARVNGVVLPVTGGAASR